MFSLDNNTLESILEKAKRKAQSVEVFALDAEELEISFDAGKLKNADRKKQSGFALRVIFDGALGFSSTTDPARIDDLVDSAIAAARCAKKVDYEFAPHVEIKTVEIFDKAVADFSPEDAIREGRYAVESMGDAYSKGLVYAKFGSNISRVRILNSAGCDVSYKMTGFMQDIMLNIVEGDSILWIDDGHYSSDLSLKTDEYVASIADRATKAETTAPKVSGKMPVIFPANQLPKLLEGIDLAVNGLNMLKGQSPLIGKVGEKLLGSVSLTDDPFIKYAIGSRPFDAEGSPSQKNELFADGVFKNFLYDIDTAASAGQTTTASAARSSLAPPHVGKSNIVMSTGNSSFDEMIAQTERGVILYNAIGGGQSNMLAGDFSMNAALGFLIENGVIVGRLTDTMISGNIYEAFSEIQALGRESKMVGSYCVPDVMFANVSVSG